MSIFDSATVAGGDTALATQYNNLRKDTLFSGGDFAVTTGSANAYILTLDAQITAYEAGMVVKFQANFTNTASATVNVNSLGAKTILKNASVNLAYGDILNNQIVTLIYDGTNFQLVSAVDSNTQGKIGTLNAGETINGATLPVPIYQNTSDNEIYACDANDTTRLNFIGFAISNSTNGNPISIQTVGIVDGFSALDEGVFYYVQDTVGTIGTSMGTYSVPVGIAISTTQILIINAESRVVAEPSDNIKISSDTTRTASGINVTGTLKSIQVAHSGRVRVTYNMTASNTNCSVTLKDGHGVSIQSNNTNSSVSVDIPVHKGETLYLEGDTSNTGGNAASCSNFRIKYDLVIESLPQVLIDTDVS